jgi:hypothetical protein
MRRARSEDGDELVGGATSVVAASSGGEPHPVLTRPAFLSHIFKFVVRKHKDVKLLYVHTAWEDTARELLAVDVGAPSCKIFEAPAAGGRTDHRRSLARLLHSHEDVPPLEGAPTVEQFSQHCFNHLVCTVWARASNYAPSIFRRLVSPRVVDLSFHKEISDSALAHLSKHITITELHLRSCKHITDAGLTHISGLQQLQMLDLAWCDKITDAGMLTLATLQQLQRLDLCGCKEITDDGLHHISELRQLRALDLSCCKQITDAGLQVLRVLKQLQTLDISWCGNASDNGLRCIAGLQQLHSLHLYGCEQITDAGLQVLAGMQQIQTLTICGGLAKHAITDAGLQHLASLKNLTKFWAGGCHKITAAAKAKFKQAHPNCEVYF